MYNRFAFSTLLIVALLLWGCPKDEKDEDENQPSNASITLTSPNGGESLEAGTSHAVTWTDVNVNGVRVWFSTDGGNNWVDVGSVGNNAQSYNWSIPNSISSNCRIRVMSADDGSVFDDSDANFSVTPAAGNDAATGAVSSDEEATIETFGGARIRVPMGAVPRYENGTAGTITFSIERDDDVQANPPSGEQLATPVYRFGPEGAVMAMPVEITLPLAEGVNPEAVSLYRINPTTQQQERFASRYDSVNRAIIGQTPGLSIWWGSYYPYVETAWGCVHVDNNSVTTWFRFCVDSFVLEYPQLDLLYMPEYAIGGLWAPIGHIGITNESDFRMPQGRYWICTQFSLDGNPNQITRGTDYIEVNDPWHPFNHPTCVDYTVGATSGPDTGRCDCNPVPTIPVGTGAVQVTLTWFNAQSLDLDLWVTEPDSERCWYANPTTDNGGQLDRDNLCGNYENGRPENIFWTTNPPVGQYVVEVDWYSDCGNGLASQEVQVRTIVQGTTRTFTRVINNGETIEIARFNVTSGGPNFLPPSETPRITLNKPRKE